MSLSNPTTSPETVNIKSVLGQILVVDDEMLVCDMISDILTDAGFVCHKTSSAEDGLARLEEESYDCLISDIRMPGIDGLELLKRARNMDQDIEVVLVTGQVDAATAITALKMGASDYLVKPFDVGEIVHCVRRVVERRRLIMENREYHQRLLEKVSEQSGVIRQQFLSAIRSLAKAVEARDPYTRGHSDRVANLSWKIASRIGLSQAKRALVLLAGRLHDIGKLGVPDTILLKKSSLDTEEWRVMQLHPVVGRDIVAQIEPPDELLHGILHHHERWDGGGYPDHLKGTNTLLVGRILAVADAFDAMTSARPYRPAMELEAAMQELKQCRGTQLDGEIAEVTMGILSEHMDNHLAVFEGMPESEDEDTPFGLASAPHV